MRNPNFLSFMAVTKATWEGAENVSISEVTLRDLAAIAAMKGMLANAGRDALPDGHVAARSVQLADALLAELEKQP